MAVQGDELQAIYDWVDGIPLSRAKKNISRDFADGVLMAEVIHHELPRIIEVHNYSAQNGIPHRQYNWNTLNQKVFKHHLDFGLSKEEILALCKAEIEKLLKTVRQKVGEKKAAESSPSSPKKGNETVEGKQETKHGNRAPHALAKIQVNKAYEENSAKTELAKEAIDKLQHTNELLKLKIEKLEQLVELKDAKIAGLTEKMQALDTQ